MDLWSIALEERAKADKERRISNQYCVVYYYCINTNNTVSVLLTVAIVTSHIQQVLNNRANKMEILTCSSWEVLNV